jgi:plasmid stabilization system protein ParE
MTFTIIFDATAMREWEEARAWIAEHRDAEQVAVLDDELGRALILLERCPKMYAILPGSKHVRRLRLTRSGYYVYHRVFSRQKTIVVTHVWHQRRQPPRL